MEWIERKRVLLECTDEEIIDEHRRRFSVSENKTHLRSSKATAEQLKMIFADLERDREHFVILFLNGQNELIEAKTMFTGSLTTSAVYPREVVKEVIKLESASVILAHNHPSGTTTPSGSDMAITKKLTEALKTIDVEVLDHIIIGGDDYMSFADKGLI